MKSLFKRFVFYFKFAEIILLTIWSSLAVIIDVVFNTKNSKFTLYIKNWANRVLKICKVKLDISGNELLNSEQRYIYISNHSSLFDIPILLASLELDVRIMYKKELEKIPIFGWGLKKSPYISVDRSNARDAMQSIENAVNEIKKNASVIIFPEGTRSSDGKLGEFKRGAFLLASRAEKTLVPIAIIGSSTILPKGSLSFNPGKIKVVINPPIENVANKSALEEKKLMQNVHTQIKNSLEQN